MTQEYQWIEHYRANGVLLGEHREHGTTWLVVADEHFEQFRLRFGRRNESEDSEIWIGIDARFSDDMRGLADYTPRYEDSDPRVNYNDVTMANDGLLSVMGRTRSGASCVDMRVGFTVRLPKAFVAPVRMALGMLQTTQTNRSGAWPLQCAIKGGG